MLVALKADWLVALMVA
jgi:hypothetical protein